EGDDRGQVVSNDSGVPTEKDPDTVRGADVAFYSYARVPKGPFPARQYLKVLPEVIFEVKSPGDTWPENLARVAEYLRAGVDVVCVLDEQTETLTTYRKNELQQTIGSDEEFSLPTFFGNFRIVIRKFFE